MTGSTKQLLVPQCVLQFPGSWLDVNVDITSNEYGRLWLRKRCRRGRCSGILLHESSWSRARYESSRRLMVIVEPVEVIFLDEFWQ